MSKLFDTAQLDGVGTLVVFGYQLGNLSPGLCIPDHYELPGLTVGS